jgi:hypothetical protein
LPNVTEIGQTAFYWAPVELVVLPKIQHIGLLAFAHCWFTDVEMIVMLGRDINDIDVIWDIDTSDAELVVVKVDGIDVIYIGNYIQDGQGLISINDRVYTLEDGKLYLAPRCYEVAVSPCDCEPDEWCTRFELTDFSSPMPDDWTAMWEYFLGYEMGDEGYPREWLIIDGEKYELDYWYAGFMWFYEDGEWIRYIEALIFECWESAIVYIGGIPSNAIIKGYTGFAQEWADFMGNRFELIELDFIRDLTPDVQIVNGVAMAYVEVNGFGLTYQWYAQDGTPIAGETKSYLVLPADNTWVGVYVVVTDWLGEEITSQVQSADVSQLTTYTVTIQVNQAHGQVNGPTEVIDSESATYTVIPNTGFEILEVRVDGVPVVLDINNQFTIQVTDDTTISVTFKLKTYTVTFVNWNGTVLKTEQVNHGTGATAPSVPSRPDTAEFSFTFTGWDVTYNNVTADITVTAIFSSTRISFPNVGSGVAITLPDGLNLPPDAVKSVTALTGANLPTHALGGFEVLITSATVADIELGQNITISFDISTFLATHENFQVFFVTQSGTSIPLSFGPFAMTSTGGGTLTSRVEGGKVYFETDTLGKFYFTATEKDNGDGEDVEEDAPNFWDRIVGWFEETWDTVSTWVEDNTTFAIVIGGGVVLFFIMLVIIIVLLARGKKRAYKSK